MPTTIQIMDKTKTKLEKLKEYPRETYDETVNKLIELATDNLKFNKDKKKGIMEYAGLWSHISDKEAKDMKRSIEEIGKNITHSVLKRTKTI